MGVFFDNSALERVLTALTLHTEALYALSENVSAATEALSRLTEDGHERTDVERDGEPHA
jgi:hypothetical protein